MRIGYSAWGFTADVKLKDGKEVSTPDGNATYTWSVLHELQRRGHEVFWMQKDRDAEAVDRWGEGAFASFSGEKRWSTYCATRQTRGEEFPPLDLLVLEWRFPVPGRNCSDGATSGVDPDLSRQKNILWRYGMGYRGIAPQVVIWDLDHKLTHKDELSFDFVPKILETSLRPRRQRFARTPVLPPTLVDDLLQHPTLPATKGLVYVGNRYERDAVFEKYLGDVSSVPVEVWGKWEPADEVARRWPNVSFKSRIGAGRLREAYGRAAACPLLAKDSYLRTCFVSPRIWECVLFGTVPIGLREASGIEELCSFVAGSSREMEEVASDLRRSSTRVRDVLRQEAAHRLAGADARHFVDAMLG